MNNVLSVQQLSWTVGNKKILDDINFDIEQGQFVGLIGPNGTGKSSLLRCLYRVNRPTEGCVTIFGKNIWQHSAKANARNVAVILQEHSDHLGLRVKDVIALGLTPHKKLFSLDTASDRQQIEAAIAQVDLQSLREQPYQYLSGGEKQRVMVARAIVQNPQLLLMDEPTNHLDVHYQAEILQLVKRMNITVLASFHDLNLAATFCDKILVLSEGKLLAYGSPVEVLTSELLRDTFHIQALVDPHPLYPTPRITYAYKE